MRWLSRSKRPEWEVVREGSTEPGFPVEQLFPTPPTPRQQWILGLGAVLSERNGENLALRLHPDRFVRPQESPAHFRRMLAQAWDVTDRASLIRALVGLLETGHRGDQVTEVGHPPVAWDYGRVVNVTRWGFGAGYVDEAAAWTLLEPVVVPVAAVYGSWGATDYVRGRAAWLGGRDADVERTVASLWGPGRRAESPWQSIPWSAGTPGGAR